MLRWCDPGFVSRSWRWISAYRTGNAAAYLRSMGCTLYKLKGSKSVSRMHLHAVILLSAHFSDFLGIFYTGFSMFSGSYFPKQSFSRLNFNDFFVRIYIIPILSITKKGITLFVFDRLRLTLVHSGSWSSVLVGEWVPRKLPLGFAAWMSCIKFVDMFTYVFYLAVAPPSSR